METSSRDITASVTKARVAVQKSMGTVTSAVTVCLTCGIDVAMALALLASGVTTVVLGHALSAEDSDRQPAG